MTSLPPEIPAAELQSIRRALGDRYAIERELGRGGMGTVYLARDIKLDRPVALKVLPAEFASQVALRDRFLRETRTAASFSHPNIVPVYAVEEADDLLAYAMGFVEGETMAERVARMGPLPVREIVRMLQDVGYALAYAHGRGVVHRDIKPDNIMIERATGRALVMDFGISRSMSHVVPAASLTRVGEVVGTPEYMSPEQASGDVVDGRSDLYSLGLTAHFAASGQTAVTGESTQKILVKQLTQAVLPVAASRSDLPPALAAAIDRCVLKDPVERFATAEALVDAIDAAQLSEPDIPVPIRLFAEEVSTLSVVTMGIVLFSWLFMRSSQMSVADTLLPVVMLGAVLLTRTLTTVSEARRLAVAGFAPDDVMRGFARVLAERSERRKELRADADTRRRRRNTLRWGVALLVISIVMIAGFLSLRVSQGNGQHYTPMSGIVLIFSATSLLGTSIVLLMKSPFRIPPGERIFRLVWMGPVGRAFVRFGARGVKVRSLSGVPQPRARVAPVPAPLPLKFGGDATADKLRAIELRVTELERWRADGRGAKAE
ncbi:MAG: serine/threonine-protein kinase [bacterium]